jgi:hypothetical protein
LQDTSLNYLVGKTALTFLDISECKFTSGGVFTLYGLNIRYLNLSELDHLDNQFIQNAIQGFRQLNTLVLSHTSDINDEAFFHIASSSELRRLQFKNLPRITNHGFDQLCQLPMLGELDIEYLPAVSLNGINVLSKLKTVFSLSIKDQKITDNGLQEMSKMEGLSYLQLNNTRGYTAAGFYHLTRLRNLKVLEITGSPLDFECIEAISKMASLNSLSISVQEPQRLELAFMRLKQIRTNLRASLATSFSGFSMEE